MKKKKTKVKEIVEDVCLPFILNGRWRKMMGVHSPGRTGVVMQRSKRIRME